MSTLGSQQRSWWSNTPRLPPRKPRDRARGRPGSSSLPRSGADLGGLASQALPGTWPGWKVSSSGARLPAGPGCELNGCLPTRDPPHPQRWALHLPPPRSSQRANQVEEIMFIGRRGAGACAAEETQVARKPPSTGTVEAVVMPLRSLSRKRMTSTTFSTSVGRGAVGAQVKGAASHFSPRWGYRCNPQLGSCLTHQQTCQVGFDPAWSWPSGGRSSWPGPWGSLPLWGSLHSRGSAPAQTGGEHSSLGAQGRRAGRREASQWSSPCVAPAPEPSPWSACPWHPW